MPKRKNSSSKFLIGAGLAAAVTAGVAAFMTKTEKGKQLSKKGRDHAKEISKQVAVRAEKVTKMTKKKYEELIDEVLAEYQKKKKITKTAGESLAKELKKEWEHVKKELKK